MKFITSIIAASLSLLTTTSVLATPIAIDYTWNGTNSGVANSSAITVNDAIVDPSFTNNGFSMILSDVDELINDNDIITLGFEVDAGYTFLLESISMTFSQWSSPTGTYGEVGFSALGNERSGFLFNGAAIQRMTLPSPVSITGPFSLDIEVFDINLDPAVTYQLNHTRLSGNLMVANVPLPASFGLFAGALAGLAMIRRKQVLSR